eukprot:CAMPEP_0201521636 /NCGR_PEP_ID=MMETSP0161_2-20130828/15320_1 /ASSEMBLY_ACC=CAM_ASM_000251 /TAXON_ID=180227 /ORGANISM="Neoparamoeba aestuarina, Strain SoJaBio B1-5/56/2" /LENGTH=137 /DNA_ID=CAMNT_0047920303 /DNA_START=44 /DNA_END=457 /DNA_ORIENTATION=+
MAVVSRISIIFLASLVNLLQMSIFLANVKDANAAFILSEVVGVLSAFTCICMLALHHFKEDIFQQALVFVAVFLFILWGIGVGFMTFDISGPFTSTGNGYFSAWVAFCISVLLTAEVIPAFGNAVGVMKEQAYEAVH